MIKIPAFAPSLSLPIAKVNSYTMSRNGREVAVTYFRAGYAPADYPTGKEWEARLLIEQSKTIKCPNIAYHLVGSKKVQQILDQPGMVERFCKDPDDAIRLRSCFMRMYPLDQTPLGIQAMENALAHPEKYVMKPQREGGGMVVLQFYCSLCVMLAFPLPATHSV